MPPALGHTFDLIRAFTSREVFIGELANLDTFLIVLSENPGNPQKEFQLQKSLEFSKQDISTGMDTWCLILPDGGIRYRGVTSCVLTPEQLKLNFDKELMALFGITRLQIALDTDPF